MIKSLVIFSALFFAVQAADGQGKIVANISNLRNDHGVCRACLFSNEASFNEMGKPVDCVTVNVKNKLARAVFANVIPGCYAVFVFHDTNNNNKMDTNFLGVPREGYGASNNRLPFAAAPHFEDNKFTVNQNGTVSLNIHLRNVL